MIVSLAIQIPAQCDWITVQNWFEPDNADYRSDGIGKDTGIGLSMGTCVCAHMLVLVYMLNGSTQRKLQLHMLYEQNVHTRRFVNGYAHVPEVFTHFANA